MGLKHWILPNNQFKTHLFFFNFWVGGNLFSLDLGPKGDSNFKPLWRSHLTSVRGPISYRIRFMASWTLSPAKPIVSRCSCACAVVVLCPLLAIYWHKRSAFGQTTGNDVSGYYFHHSFPVFFPPPSSPFLIEGMIGSKNLFIESCSQAVTIPAHVAT